MDHIKQNKQKYHFAITYAEPPKQWFKRCEESSSIKRITMYVYKLLINMITQKKGYCSKQFNIFKTINLKKTRSTKLC